MENEIRTRITRIPHKTKGCLIKYTVLVNGLIIATVDKAKDIEPAISRHLLSIEEK